MIEQVVFVYCRNLKIVDLSYILIKELLEEVFLFFGIKKIVLFVFLEIVGKEVFYGCIDLNVIDISYIFVKELQNGVFGKFGIFFIFLFFIFKIVGVLVFIEIKNLKELILFEGSEVIDLEVFFGSFIQKVIFLNIIYYIDCFFYSCFEFIIIEIYGIWIIFLFVDRMVVIVSECFNYFFKFIVFKIFVSIVKIGISVLNKC